MRHHTLGTDYAHQNQDGGKCWRWLIVAIASFALIGPPLAKEKGISSGKARNSYALAIDVLTGNCQVEVVNADQERPAGFRLLGKYDSLKEAENGCAQFS